MMFITAAPKPWRHAIPGLLAAAALALTACGASSPTPDEGAGSADRPSLTGLVVSADLSLYDPMVAGPANTQGPMMQVLYDGLVQFPPGEVGFDTIEPSLATEWSVSDDGLTYTFTLREGVQFHGGYGEMTAEDVVFSYERQMDPAGGGSYVGEFSNVESVTAVDDYTVEIVLKEPNPYFLVTIANYHGGYIVSKDAVEELGEDFTTHPIGTGPFEFERYSPTDRVVFKAFDEHWGGVPKIAELTYLFVPDPSAQLTALQSGDVQFGRVAQSDGAVASAQDAGLEVKLMSAIPWTLHLNIKDYPALQDVRVREALSYGTDREALAAAFGLDVATPAPQHVPPAALGALQSVPEDLRLDYDPAKAKELLAEAGYAGGLDFEIVQSETSVYPTMWQVLQEQWTQIGVTLNLRQVDHQTFNTEADTGTLSMVIHGGNRVPIAPLFLREWYASDGDSNFSHYGHDGEGIEGLLADGIAAAVAGDKERANELYQQAQIKLLEELPAIPLVWVYTPIVRDPAVDLGYEPEDSLVYAFEITADTTVNE